MISHITQGIALFEGCQASPACLSDKTKIKIRSTGEILADKDKPKFSGKACHGATLSTIMSQELAWDRRRSCKLNARTLNILIQGTVCQPMIFNTSQKTLLFHYKN